MTVLSSAARYYLWLEPVDMRKSFNGLQGMVTNQLRRDALSGEVFIFMNRRRDQVKMLVWDRSGFVIYYKRLEQGRFELPRPQERVRGQALPWSDLVLILEGISLSSEQKVSDLYPHKLLLDNFNSNWKDWKRWLQLTNESWQNMNAPFTRSRIITGACPFPST